MSKQNGNKGRRFDRRTGRHQFQNGYDRCGDLALPSKPVVEDVLVATQRECGVLECVFFAQQFFQHFAQFSWRHGILLGLVSRIHKTPPAGTVLQPRASIGSPFGTGGE